MPRYPGFCGPSYRSQSPVADAEMTMNWYVEQMESAGAKAPVTLYPSPGLRKFAVLSTSPIRALFYENGRCFAIGGVNLVELLSDGSVTELGVIADDGQPASISSSGQELLIISAGIGYRLRLSDNNLVKIRDFSTDFPPDGDAATGAFCDGFFIVLQSSSRTFFISEPFLAESWSALEFTTSSASSDNFVTLIEDHEELWLFGSQHIQPYFDSGDADFPFSPNQSAKIEQGCAAKNSVARLDNTLFWLGGDDRGGGIVWRANGYLPARVSNHALENAIQGYGRIDDAVAYAYQANGHQFYHLYFPTANKSWVYDVATGQWHERGWWNTVSGQFDAHHSQNHAHAFGKHLVGDWASGTVYEMSIDFNDDDGNPIRRVRRAPAVFLENKRNIVSAFEVYLEPGLGVDGTAQGSDPQVFLRISRDSGKKWSNELSASAGKIGESQRRVRYLRLGQARSFTPEVAVSDPIPWRLVDAFYDPIQGLS